MKILAIDPGIQWIEGKIVQRVYPRIGFAYIATVLSKVHTVNVVDVSAYQTGFSELAERLTQVNPDMVCITAVAFHHDEALETGRLVKKINPNTTVVFGGAHPTALYEEFLAAGDVVVLGEGEKTIKEIAEKVKKQSKDWDDISGIAFRNEDEVVVRERKELISNLDELPFPDWELFDYSKYLCIPSDKYGREIRFYSISGMRGCPYTCSFCSSIHGSTVRCRSAESVVDEMEYNLRKFGAHHFDFADSNATLDKERFIEFCELMEERKLDVLWNIETRVDLVDEEIAEAAKKAGCQVFCYGIESGDEFILQKIGKTYSVDQIEEAVRVATEAGLIVKSSFIIGHPFETAETAEKTFALAKYLRMKYGMDLYFGLIDVYPKQKVYEMAENQEGCTWVEGMRNNWSAIQRNTATLETEELDKDQLENLYHTFTENIKKIPAKDYYKGRTKSKTKFEPRPKTKKRIYTGYRTKSRLKPKSRICSKVKSMAKSKRGLKLRSMAKTR